MAGSEGEAEPVIAVGGGGDAALPVLGREAKDFVGGTAELERSGLLQVFELREDLDA